MHRADLIIPQEALLALGHAADAAAAAFQIIEHLFRREIHLLAQPLGHDRDVDIFQKLMRVGAQAAAVERGQNTGLAA